MPDDKYFKAIKLGKDTPQPAPIKLKDGSILTPEMFHKSAQNGLPFSSMDKMAEYYNEWSRKVPPAGQPTQTFPYYRHYGTGSNIPGGDVEILKAKYSNDPQIMKYLNENIAKPGEVPMYSPTTGDVVRKLLAQQDQQQALMNMKATTSAK